VWSYRDPPEERRVNTDVSDYKEHNCKKWIISKSLKKWYKPTTSHGPPQSLIKSDDLPNVRTDSKPHSLVILNDTLALPLEPCSKIDDAVGDIFDCSRKRISLERPL
jgi:hypothetical protein